MKYLFYDLNNERAPHGTTDVIIKDGVGVIGENAFDSCNSLVKVVNSVTEIEGGAFYGCDSLRSIQLQFNLQCIEGQNV